MTATTMIHIRIDEQLKDQASEALESMGLSVSDAVRVFLKRVVADQAMPFEVKVPNATTRAAMEEARNMTGPFMTEPRNIFDALEKSAES